MQGYEEDGYGDYEDYEEEGYERDEEGEEEEYEEERPSAESQEYLELRARIKERLRKKLQKENGSAVSKSQEMKKKSLDNYGSFFGPSQPVIAQRVIQESKSLLENPHLIFRNSNLQNNKKTSSSSGTGSKNGTHQQIPKVRNELNSKVQKIKDTRDYSFLLSDDAELPTTIPPASQNASVSKSDAQSAQKPQKSRQPSGSSARYMRGGCDGGKSIPTNALLHSQSGAYRTASTSRPSLTLVDPRAQLQSKRATGPCRPVASMDSRRQSLSNNGTGPGWPVASMDSRRHSQSSNGTEPDRPMASMDRRRQLESSGTGPGRPMASMDRRRQLESNGTGPGRPMASMDRRRQLESNRTGPGRPIGGPNGGSSQVPLTTGQKKAFAPGRKAIPPPACKPLPSKMPSSLPKQEVERKRVVQEPKKILPAPKHSVPSSRSQISKPVKQLSSRPPMKDTQLKRKSSRPFADEDDDDEDMKALSMIRKMFNYDRYKNRDYDDDDLSDMEVPFDEILREEDRSARIARKEDEEQLRLIEEEERQERMRKLAKKRKLSRRQ